MTWYLWILLGLLFGLFIRDVYNGFYRASSETAGFKLGQRFGQFRVKEIETVINRDEYGKGEVPDEVPLPEHDNLIVRLEK